MAPAQDYISWVEITDTYGTKHQRFDAKSIVRIRGKNGAGKTSITNAINSIFQGGSDPTIIRKGSLKSVVILGLASGATITKTTARKKDGGVRTDLEVLDPAGNVMPAPQTFVNRLATAQAVDPGAILKIDASTAAGRKALMELFLHIVVLSFSVEEVVAAASYEMVHAKPGKGLSFVDEAWIGERTRECAVTTPPGPMDVDGLKRIIAQVRDQRRRVGAVYDDSDATVNSLRGSLPRNGEATDYQGLIGAAEQERREVDNQRAERRMDVERGKHEALTALSRQQEGELSDIDAEIDEKIAALNDERSRRKLAVSGEYNGKERRALELVQQELQKIDQDVEPLLEDIATRIAEARAGAEAQQRTVLVREQIEAFTVKFLEAGWKRRELDDVIARLESLRQKKLDEVPVKGLEVGIETGPLIDGIPWQNVNTARRVQIAIQLCALCVGSLAFMFLDGAQDLDTETRTSLEEGIVAAGYQLIETLVSDSPLTIEVLPHAA